MLASKGEVKIHEILEMYEMNYKEEYSFDDLTSSNGKPLRFDFAVFDEDDNLDFLIEYQGEQHYEPRSVFGGYSGLRRQQYNDSLKRKYCKAHGYTLVEIPYNHYNIMDYDYIMKKAGY